MERLDTPIPSTDTGASAQELDLPQGDHPLELAARRGIGPLSPRAQEVWHGQAIPCVSCGLIVLRDQRQCDHCGQDLGDEMIEKMKAHAGPWYVLEHLHPFPGVSLERIVRQIRRGVLTEISIVRGPATDFQWRFALETPGLCRYFGKCWKCQHEIAASDASCSSCLAPLSMKMQDTTGGESAAGESQSRTPLASDALSTHLEELSAAVGKSDVQRSDAIWDEPPRVGGIRATWIAVLIIALVIAALLWMTAIRSDKAKGSEHQANALTTSGTAVDRTETLPHAS